MDEKERCRKANHGYKTYEKAERALKGLLRSNSLTRRPNHIKLNVYWCEVCGKYHIGNKAVGKGGEKQKYPEFTHLPWRW